MTLGRKIMLLDNERTHLGGRDVGQYPLHHFTHNRSTSFEKGWPLRPLFAGDDEWVAGCHRFRRNSCIFAIELVLEGSFVFIQNGRRHKLLAGEVFLVHLDKDNEMFTEDSYARKCVMSIGGDELRGVLCSLGLENLDIIRPDDPQRLQQIFKETEGLFIGDDIAPMRKLSLLAYEALLILGESVRANKMPEALQLALSYLESNKGRQVIISELAGHCACSPMTLQRLFRKHCKMSPINYFIEMKMNLAKELLSVSNMPIKAIAHQLGYSNQLYFSSEFKKRVGLSPSEYRVSPKNEGPF